MQRRNLSIVLYVQNYYAKIEWGCKSMKSKNGETKEIVGRAEDRKSEDESRGLVNNGIDCSVYGYESVRNVEKYSSGQANSGVIVGERRYQTDNGKIAERLELVEKAHITYIENQERQLEYLLNEVKEQKKEFLNALQVLKQEIVEFVSRGSTEDM
ncbi:MAG: hypothetical protein ACFB2X_01420 [Rivularia sp. (in: cyanobacteria)]